MPSWTKVKAKNLWLGESAPQVKVTATAAELNIMDGVTATAAELNQAAGTVSKVVLASASTLAITQALHANKIILASRAAGIAITLPEATGSGLEFSVRIGITMTSDLTIKVSETVGDDIIQGVIFSAQDTDNATLGWESAATSDTITLDGTTTGGYIGDRIDLLDAVAGKWIAQGWTISTGTEATPWSATVTTS